MTVQLTNANQAVSVTPYDLIKSALKDAAILGIGEELSDPEAVDGLEKLQRLIDTLNAMREMIFSVSFQQFNLQANHSPHTIGPAGDFNVPLRPVRIQSAAFILNSGTNNPVDTPIKVRGDRWWADNPLKSMTSSICTDLYYSPDQPLGNCNFWPICNVANPVRLQMWLNLSQAVDLQTPIGFVQGYWELIVSSLAISLGPMYGKEASPTLVAINQRAQRAVLDNNDGPPVITTDGCGMPSEGHGGRPDFNFLTGLRD